MKRNTQTFNRPEFLVFIVALALRLFRLGSQSLWLDEAVIAEQVKADSLSELLASIETHIGPLFHITVYAFTKLFGYSETALRVPSALYGAFTVLLLYHIGRELLDQRTATAAAWLMAISPLHIWYSQECRMYALWVFLLCGGVLAFIKALKQSSLGLWVIFAVCMAAAQWTYLNTAFVFVPLGLILLLVPRYRKAILPFTLASFFAVGSYASGFLAVASKSGAMGIGSVRPVGVMDIGYSFLAFHFGTSLGPSLTEIRMLRAELGGDVFLHILMQFGALLVPATLLMTGIWGLGILRLPWKTRREQSIFLVLLYLLPVLLVFATAWVSRSIPFNVRYILCGLPFHVLILAQGLMALSKRVAPLIGPFALLVLLFSLVNHYFDPRHGKEDFRGVSQYLAKNTESRDALVVFSEHARPLLSYYDSNGRLAQAGVPIDATLETVKARWMDARHVFLVLSERRQEYPKGLVDQTVADLQSDWSECGAKNFNKIEVRQYCRKKVETP